MILYQDGLDTLARDNPAKNDIARCQEREGKEEIFEVETSVSRSGAKNCIRSEKENERKERVNS